MSEIENQIGRITTGVRVGYEIQGRRGVGIVGWNRDGIVEVWRKNGTRVNLSHLHESTVVQQLPGTGTLVPLPPRDGTNYRRGRRTLVPGVR